MDNSQLWPNARRALQRATCDSFGWRGFYDCLAMRCLALHQGTPPGDERELLEELRSLAAEYLETHGSESTPEQRALATRLGPLAYLLRHDASGIQHFLDFGFDPEKLAEADAELGDPQGEEVVESTGTVSAETTSPKAVQCGVGSLDQQVFGFDALQGLSSLSKSVDALIRESEVAQANAVQAHLIIGELKQELQETRGSKTAAAKRYQRELDELRLEHQRKIDELSAECEQTCEGLRKELAIQLGRELSKAREDFEAGQGGLRERLEQREASLQARGQRIRWLVSELRVVRQANHSLQAAYSELECSRGEVVRELGQVVRERGDAKHQQQEAAKQVALLEDELAPLRQGHEALIDEVEPLRELKVKVERIPRWIRFFLGL